MTNVLTNNQPARRTDTFPLAALAALLSVLIVLGIGIGSSFMPPDRVLAALLRQSDGPDQVIVWTLRLPRVALAALAGACLALAGTILQRVTRNPLAAPSILGITDGAAVGVVAFLWTFSDESNNLTVSVHWLPLAAVTGAAVFTVIVATLTFADSRSDPTRLILYGVAIGALAKAAVTIMMILGPVYRASQALTWLTGSVGAAHWTDVWTVASVLALSVPLLWLAVLPLTQLQLDPDSARSTGLSLGRSQTSLIGLAVLLTAAAVAFVGAIGFVGLIAPHLARRIIAGRGAPFLIASATLGACLVLAADIIARIAIPPLELPAGALTALFGAPLFLYLLLLRRRPA
ncbi:FecCD family ABC transporter permease [Qingshengfaniella alkalisoli]|uniref:Iron ABC transporter permease n=1 Tax=Qingshengfaniella alkalisoli TaxID=2599296 RepID=A0A5B8J9R3_9RHOB|nr:iron ABC transporter permease [Qingshengfaniella alkalisoli]QDY71047.1 iron ABC transporter permease [Qingshengfaniella alkalisoli]